MRVESDRQGHHRSEAPACHRCGVPLLAEARFCPYCERWLDEGALNRIWRRRRVRGSGRLAQRRLGPLSERALLAIGFVVLAFVAAGSIVAALVT